MKGNTNKMMPFYQTKTKSDKNVMNQCSNEITHTIYLNKFIDKGQYQEIESYIIKEKLSPEVLFNGVKALLKKYIKGNKFFYEILDLLLSSGAPVNAPISINNSQQNNIKEDENVSLLFLAIMNNDIDFVNIILKYNPNLNLVDKYNKNVIIYCIIYNNDIPEILQKIIRPTNINHSLYIDIKPGYSEYHSTFTLACMKNLIRFVKCLLENCVDVNFRTKPNMETGLHLAVKFGSDELVSLLLSYSNLMVDLTNKDGKRAVDLIDDNDNNKKIIFKNYYDNIKNNQLKYNNNYINKNNYNQQLNQYNNQIYMNSNNNNYNYQNMNSDSNSTNYINMSNNLMDEDGNSFLSGENDSKNINMQNNLNTSSSNSKDYSYNNLSIPKNTIQSKMNLFKQKISCENLNKKNIKYDIEIPVDFKKEINNCSKYQKNTLNNFLNHNNNSNSQMFIDLTNKTFDLELKINEIQEQLKEKTLKINEYKSQMDFNSNRIQDQKNIMKEKMHELNYLQSLSSQNEQKISELKKTQNELYSKIPPDKISHKSNKNLKIEEFRQLKFLQTEPEEDYIIKTLQKDLLDYEKYNKAIMKKKIPLIENLVNLIQNTVNEVNPEYQVKIYGSYANGLCVPWSDLNLVLINKNFPFSLKNINNSEDNFSDLEDMINNNNYDLEQVSRSSSSESTKSANSTANNLLYSLYMNLKNQNWVKQYNFNEYIFGGVLRLITSEEYGKMSIDINVENEKHNGLRCVNLVKSYIKEYVALKPIIIALKSLLKNSNLNNPFTGGLTSYGLILMVVHYIQFLMDNDENEKNIIGNVFYGFLFHYGVKFDFSRYIIVSLPNSMNNKENNNVGINQNNRELVIIDPLNNKNNVAKANYQYMNLKMALMIAFMVTKEDCECGCHYGKAVYENTLFSTEHSCLKRMLNSVKRFTDSGK